MGPGPPRGADGQLLSRSVQIGLHDPLGNPHGGGDLLDEHLLQLPQHIRLAILRTEPVKSG
jgi:hypothetical protein